MMSNRVTISRNDRVAIERECLSALRSHCGASIPEEALLEGVLMRCESLAKFRLYIVYLVWFAESPYPIIQYIAVVHTRYVVEKHLEFYPLCNTIVGVPIDNSIIYSGSDEDTQVFKGLTIPQRMARVLMAIRDHIYKRIGED